MSLFHSGRELFQRFRISLESEIIFADYTQDLLYPYQNNIKFTSKALIFTYPKSGFENIHDEWTEVESLDFYTWQNVLMIQNVKGAKTLKEFHKTEIDDWLSTIEDPPLNETYINVKKGNIVFMIVGKPRSMRSKGGKHNFRQKVEAKKKDIAKVYPHPFNGNVEMKIDVFLDNVDHNDRPDIDRLAALITDSFQGIAYVDDKQIRDLRPRIIDVSSSYKKLEVMTEPMGIFSLDDLPVGSVFPLAIGCRDYYVVRIMYYQ